MKELGILLALRAKSVRIRTISDAEILIFELNQPLMPGGNMIIISYRCCNALLLKVTCYVSDNY